MQTTENNTARGGTSDSSMCAFLMFSTTMEILCVVSYVSMPFLVGLLLEQVIHACMCASRVCTKIGTHVRRIDRVFSMLQETENTIVDTSACERTLILCSVAPERRTPSGGRRRHHDFGLWGQVSNEENMRCARIQTN